MSTQTCGIPTEQSLNWGGRNLDGYKCAFCAKQNSYAGCPDLSPAILAQFTLEMCGATKDCKNNTNTLIFGIRGQKLVTTLWVCEA